jgi:hypothetical protein
MTTYLQFHEDSSGDLVDISYWHGFCAPAEVRALGSWPCPDSIDYDVYCEGCEERVKDVGLTDAGILYVCERGWDAASMALDTWELQRAVENGWLSDTHGRDWGPRMLCETCLVCGQPDNCGDCEHGRLTDEQASLLGATV